MLALIAGTASVTLLELAPKVVGHLRENQARLAFDNVKLIAGEALKYLQNAPERFDLVFLDPPYRQDWLARLEPHLVKVLTPGARIYLEAEHPVDSYAGLELRKSGKAGQVHYRLFALPPAGESA